MMKHYQSRDLKLEAVIALNYNSSGDIVKENINPYFLMAYNLEFLSDREVKMIFI